LEHLRLFASYGKLLQEQNENTCPFQRLIFTIRDWDLDDELGLEAGAHFLQGIMDEMGDTEEGSDLMASIQTSFTKTSCCIMRHPGSALRSDDFKGESDQLDEEFKENLTELIPFIANDDTDSSKCPTLKVDPLRQVLSVDDFIDQVKAIKQIYDDGLIEKPESMYSAFSKLSSGKAMKLAAKYWKDKIGSLLPDMPESRREKPLRFDFLNSAEFEEKVDKYASETWEFWNNQPKLADQEAQEFARTSLETKMGDDIEQMRSENLNREALYDKTWAARCACLIGSCACCLGAKCC